MNYIMVPSTAPSRVKPVLITFEMAEDAKVRPNSQNWQEQKDIASLPNKQGLNSALITE